MTFGSLFSGIGGIDLGLERAGMTCKWQVEIDDFCQKVLTKHWPNVLKYKDIKEVQNLPYVDLIAGGFPCQDISLAGKREGIKEGNRSGLWFEFAKIIRMVRSEYIILENVSGLLNNGMGTVLGDLATSGYDAEWQNLPASSFGAPHRRERVFIVAYANSLGCGYTQKRRNKVPIFNGVLPQTLWPWISEPPLLRSDDGVPNRVDRLKSLGNAVVPQVAEYIGKAIINSNQCIQDDLPDKTPASA